jgi:dolichyl-phosphate-mannose--protein O-mannosyl transferase
MSQKSLSLAKSGSKQESVVFTCIQAQTLQTRWHGTSEPETVLWDEKESS